MANSPSTISVNRIRIGFEAECFLSHAKLLKADIAPEGAFGSILKQPVVSYLETGDRRALDYTKWNLVTDSSLEADGDADSYPVELVSPVLEYPDFQEALQQSFSAMRLWGAKQATNDSCGLHLNLSVDGINLRESLDLMKLIILLGESHIAGLFNRDFNSYAQRIEPYIKNYLSAFADLPAQIKELVSRPLYPVTENVDLVIPLDKYFSFNLTKIKKHNFIEFRLVGGADYHTRIPEIVATAKKLSWALVSACDPTAYRELYITKLMRLVSRAPFATQAEDEDSDAAQVEKPTQELQRSDVSVKLVGDTYHISIAAPVSADLLLKSKMGSVKTTFTAVRSSVGFALTGCNTDYIPVTQRAQMYQMFSKGIGHMRFELSLQAEKQLYWAVDSFLSAIGPRSKDWVFLLGSCPTLFYALNKSPQTLLAVAEGPLRGALIDTGMRRSLREALSKCNPNSVWDVYSMSHVVPAHMTQEVFLDLVKRKGDNIVTSFFAPANGVSHSSFFYQDELPFIVSAMCQTYKLDQILRDIFDYLIPLASHRVPGFAVAQPVLDDLIRSSVGRVFSKDNSAFRNMCSYMRKSEPNEFPLFRDLLALGSALDVEYIVSLVNSLKGELLSPAWRSFVQELA